MTALSALDLLPPLPEVVQPLPYPGMSTASDARLCKYGFGSHQLYMRSPSVQIWSLRTGGGVDIVSELKPYAQRVVTCRNYYEYLDLQRAFLLVDESHIDRKTQLSPGVQISDHEPGKFYRVGRHVGFGRGIESLAWIELDDQIRRVVQNIVALF